MADDTKRLSVPAMGDDVTAWLRLEPAISSAVSPLAIRDSGQSADRSVQRKETSLIL
jgi:hypothetical protein